MGECAFSIISVLILAVTVSISSIVVLRDTEQSLRDLKQQAFERGYMVQCLGRTGFYWECD
jgi:hypothetical protein